jgi:hypothetical protein
MVLFLLRSASRGASSSLSQFHKCTTMNARASRIAANRYLTVSSSSSSGSGRISTGNINTGSGSGGGSLPTEGSGTSPEGSGTGSSNKDPSSGGSPPPPTAPAESVYIHPLSQIVLQNLQSEECHDWMRRAGFDSNLTVQKDGTFLLESSTAPSSSARARIWTEYCPDEKKHWLIYTSITGGYQSRTADDYMDQAAEVATALTAEARTTTVQHKYLLQDNLRTAWQKGTKSSSAPDRIQEFVRELMHIVR